MFRIKVKLKSGKIITIEPKAIHLQVIDILNAGVKPQEIPFVFNRLPDHLLTVDLAMEIGKGISQWLTEKIVEQRSIRAWEYNVVNLRAETRNICRMIITGDSVTLLKHVQGEITMEMLMENTRLESLAAEYFNNGPEDLGPEEIDNAMMQAVEQVLKQR